MKISQTGVSSMIVLILVVLLILVGWEIGQFASQFSETGQEAANYSANKKCVGSNTTFDCYDQDEGADFEDDTPPTEPLIFDWRDDGKP